MSGQLVEPPPKRPTWVVVLLILAVAISATANNFASRIKAEILGDYNFVSVVPDSAIQLLFSLAVLSVLFAKRRVNRAQLRYLFRCGRTLASSGAWLLLFAAGVNDIANNVTGLAAQPHLTTFMMSLMDQATTPFTVFFSMLILGVRYNAIELAAILVIMAAAIGCVCLAGAHDSGDSKFWAVYAAATTSFAALSFVLKEITFRGYKAFVAGPGSTHRALRVQLQSDQPVQIVDAQEDGTQCQVSAVQANFSETQESLNIFLVSAVINLVGLLSSVPLALLNHTTVNSSPAVPALTNGLRFLFENPQALAAYSVYIAINTVFNISLIATTSYASALLSFLSLKAAVPLTAILSGLPWPVIGAKPLDRAQWLALLVMIGGISAFRAGTLKRERLASVA